MLQQEEETDDGQSKKVSACYCDGSALALMLTVCINGRSASPENSGSQGGDTSTKGVPIVFQNVNPDLSLPSYKIIKQLIYHIFTHFADN